MDISYWHVLFYYCSLYAEWLALFVASVRGKHIILVGLDKYPAL
jgi:hypothetical protein